MKVARSISSLFAHPVARDATAAIQDGRHIKFGEFADDVAALSAHLQTRQEQRWLLLSENAYAIAVGFLAALFAGRIAIFPANLQLGHIGDLSDRIDGILSHDHAVPPAAKVISILGHDGDPTRAPLNAFDAEQAEIILHTSGTTGQPLSVHKSLLCLEQELLAFAEVFKQLSPYAVLATVPAYHIYGLLFRVLWPLVAGQPFAAELIRHPEELERALAKAEHNLLISSPAFLGRARKVLDINALKERLSGVFSSGGPLPPDVAAEYNAKLIKPIIEVYGSTETGGIGYRSVLDAAKPTPLTALPGVTLSVNSDSGTLSVSSPFLYKCRSFQTGDRARLLPDGRFELLGRIDRIVKIEERRISLAEVEQRLVAQAGVSTVRVELLGASGGRNFLSAVIVPTSAGWTALTRDGKRALTKALRTALMPYMDLAAIPRKWRFVRGMPEMAQGKAPLSHIQAMFGLAPEGVTRPILLDREAGSFTLRHKLKLPPELEYFEGHFDGHPILPGVIQLDWAIKFAREAFPLGGKFERIDALKFFRVMCAGDEVTLELRFDPNKERLHFRYSSERHEHSAGRIQFGGTA